MASLPDVAALLAVESRDHRAFERLLPLVYAELPPDVRLLILSRSLVSVQDQWLTKIKTPKEDYRSNSIATPNGVSGSSSSRQPSRTEAEEGSRPMRAS